MALRRLRKLVLATMPTETRFIISTVIRCSSTIWRREALLPSFAERCPVKLFLAGSFFDSGSERLYAYEVYTENGDSEPMIASLDLHTLAGGWRVTVG